MMRPVLPLYVASLREFARNWKSVSILLGAPLLVIGLIFISLSQTHLTKIPVGYTANMEIPQTLLTQLQSSFDVKAYNTLEDCMVSLRAYKSYACIAIENAEKLSSKIYYDNTRDPVSWEVLQLLKLGIDGYKAAVSLQTIDGFLDKAGSTLGSLETVGKDLSRTRQDIQTYVVEVDKSIAKISVARADISQTMTGLKSDLNQLKTTQQITEQESKSSYTYLNNQLSRAQSDVNAVPQTDETATYRSNALSSILMAQSSLSAAQNELNYNLAQMDQKIETYESGLRKGESYNEEMAQYIQTLVATRQDLQTYLAQIQVYEKQLAFAKSELEKTSGLDATVIINPIQVNDQPAYLPQFDVASPLAKDISYAQVASFLNLQILYPKLLFLIVFFLSILVSCSIALRSIHTPASTRIMLLPRVYVGQLLALILASLTIVIVPILIVLVTGETIFKLNIIGNLGSVVSLVLLVSLFFVILGIIFSYIFYSESLTLLVAIFVLILTLFFSGFLFPIERMQSGISMVVDSLPLRVAVQSFYKVVYHGLGAQNADISKLLSALGIVSVVLLLLKLMPANRSKL